MRSACPPPAGPIGIVGDGTEVAIRMQAWSILPHQPQSRSGVSATTDDQPHRGNGRSASRSSARARPTTPAAILMAAAPWPSREPGAGLCPCVIASATTASPRVLPHLRQVPSTPVLWPPPVSMTRLAHRRPEPPRPACIPCRPVRAERRAPRARTGRAARRSARVRPGRTRPRCAPPLP